MAEAPYDLMLKMLGAIHCGIVATCEDIREFRHRLGTVEQQITHVAAIAMSHRASVSMRLDRLTDRVERIERRLAIVPAS